MNFNRIFFTASAFVLSAAALAAVTPEEYYQQGCDFYAKGNMVEARKAFEASARGGNAMSQVCFANFLKKEGKLKDAIKWLEKAVAEKHPVAMRALGNIYSRQEEFRDFKKAVKYYQMAVDHGNVEAMYSLANCYFHGAGVTQDKSKGVVLLHRAAEKNLAVAQYILGTLYEKGDGVIKDAKKAVEWYSRAADNGHLPAFLPLSAAYFNGDGVKQDLVKAMELLRIAVAQGDANSIAELNAYKIFNVNEKTEAVKFVYVPQNIGKDGKDKMPKMEFRKDGKLILSIEAKVQNLCFVEEIRADKKNNKMRLTFTPFNFDGKEFDWRIKLLDLKGDGDFRYLIIADYHTGTAEGDMKGYVVDVKDNFKHIATIPVGEAFDLPYTNPKLIFDR